MEASYNRILKCIAYKIEWVDFYCPTRQEADYLRNKMADLLPPPPTYQSKRPNWLELFYGPTRLRFRSFNTTRFEQNLRGFRGVVLIHPEIIRDRFIVNLSENQWREFLTLVETANQRHKEWLP